MQCNGVSRILHHEIGDALVDLPEINVIMSDVCNTQAMTVTIFVKTLLDSRHD